ncbi:MAG: UDP-N-acetylglucosamine 1-carboxyvinyltransferase [Armatimonadota bacterium]|nr:UDP-N-acetylglucosamine 1-carboxyvinyltransferase [Armatimonadota bacterium]
MDKLYVTGGTRLEGSVRISGSKNGALAIMAGALLAKGKTVLRNVPKIGDIFTMVETLRSLGAQIEMNGDWLSIDATNLTSHEAPYELVKRMRASFCVMGPLLARLGRARVPMPGGCDIGARPIDFHVKGIQTLGAYIETEHGCVYAESLKLRGAQIYLDFPSAGTTQHLMTAACLADGVTVIQNAAAEPEVTDLADYLTAMGAKIEGAGTTTVKIAGVDELRGVDYTIIPDRMEAGTFGIAAAITGGDVTVTHVVPEHLEPFIPKLQDAGARVDVRENTIRFRMLERPIATDVMTMPHPGFPTDMQQPMVALLSLADGTSVVTENVYERRFKYISELQRMGADIKQEGRTAIIKGVSQLTGAPVTATDLRAGAALVVAALAAEGKTEIAGTEHIDRGYENLVEKLCSLGADIYRADSERRGTALCLA